MLYVRHAWRFFIFSTLIFVLPACFAFKSQDDASKNIPSENIVTNVETVVDDQGHLSPQVLQLLDLMNIAHDGTLSDIVTKTQASWLRKPGTERWQMDALVTQHDVQIRSLFDAIGLCKQVSPIQKTYDYLLLLGALFSSMEQRFEYAIELWKAGIRYKKIILLAGARPATLEQGENLSTFLKFSGQDTLEKVPTTEVEMIQFLYDLSALPKDMRKVPVQIIDVPMLSKADGSLRRPTTADTIEWWLQTKPTPGTCLAISNQPYVNYQQAVLKTLLSKNYPVQTVGAACVKEVELAIMFDTLARVLYQELQYLQKK